MTHTFFNSDFVTAREMEWFAQVSKDIFIILDGDYVIQGANPAWHQVVGDSEIEAGQSLLMDYIHPEDQQLFIDQLRGKDRLSIEVRCSYKEGTYKWVDWYAIHRSEQRQKAIMLIGREVSYERMLELELKESKELGRVLLESADTSISIMDAEDRVIAVNKQFEELYGWRNEEIMGDIMPFHSHSEQVKKDFIELRKRVFQGEKIVNHEAVRARKDGSLLPVSITVFPIRDINGHIVASLAQTRDMSQILDIQQQLMNSRKELEETNEQFQSILNSIIEVFFYVDKSWNFLFVNKLFANVLERDPEKLIGKSFWGVLPSKISPLAEDMLQESMRTGRKARFKDFSPLMNRYYEIFTFPTKNGMAVHARDIHDQEMNLQRLEDSERQIREITENINEVFWITSVQDLKTEYVSAAYERVWKRPIKDVYQNKHSFADAVHPEDREAVIQSVADLDHIQPEIEFRILWPDGSVRWIRSKHTLVCGEDGQPLRIITVSADITELKEKDSLIRKGDKLGVVGQLAAGIAHEIRNPLTTIKGFVQLWRQDSNQVRYSEIILSELERIEFIMNEFLMLAKPHQETCMEPTDMNQVLKETAAFMQPEALLKETVMVCDLQEDLPKVMMEVKQIKQVMINLIKNALEAMENGGTIKIRTRKKRYKVIVQVEDTGSGISKERITRLGEPFYSNKEKGTGLGLMVSFKIIQNHHGTITFESEEGKGTLVEISLPFASQ
ncbi:PAS domain S-box protein [Bacillus thermotolerans]|uniref:PAS domain S-box protein n=1 Tax=Bacillus thermotolerans TaxID=1221996 RepID=UPI000591DDF6|nr:PAS domain S-box protein [Bacillus thermotolerans]KKB44537.1 phosphodiesterase [Bacillus thermotolerans]